MKFAIIAALLATTSAIRLRSYEASGPSSSGSDSGSGSSSGSGDGLREVFNQCDTNHNGQLSGNETKSCAEHALGRPLTEAEDKWGSELFEKDAGKDGTLDFEEFRKFAMAVMHKIQEEHQEEHLRGIFDKLDTDHDGQITGKEVVLGIEHYLGEKLSHQQYEEGKALFEA